jgi:hypothetical protein
VYANLCHLCLCILTCTQALIASALDTSIVEVDSVVTAVSGVELVICSCEFTRGSCEVNSESFQLRGGLYDSVNFTNTFNQLGVTTISNPDLQYTTYDGGLYCFPDIPFSNDTCANYTKTFIFPPTTLRGFPITRVNFEAEYLCFGDQLLTLTVTTASGVTVLQGNCSGIDGGPGFGVISPEPIVSIEIHSTFLDYYLEIMYLIATDCSTLSPTLRPTAPPTISPTSAPTKSPTKQPTKSPTKQPTKSPTKQPTKSPTKQPTKSPTKQPTKSPTRRPTANGKAMSMSMR